eukprot:246391-Amorphochlora_amoeboformis.AAC.1
MDMGLPEIAGYQQEIAEDSSNQISGRVVPGYSRDSLSMVTLRRNILEFGDSREIEFARIQAA